MWEHLVGPSCPVVRDCGFLSMITLIYFDLRNTCVVAGLCGGHDSNKYSSICVLCRAEIYGQFHCPGGLWRTGSSPLLSVATPTASLPTPGYCLKG